VTEELTVSDRQQDQEQEQDDLTKFYGVGGIETTGRVVPALQRRSRQQRLGDGDSFTSAIRNDDK
jgi:hypothetical protein